MRFDLRDIKTRYKIGVIKTGRSEGSKEQNEQSTSQATGITGI